VWVAVLANHGAYDAMVLSATAEHYRRVVRSGASLVALVAVWHMLTDDHVNGLSVVVLAGVVSASTLAGRAAVQHFVRRARERRHLLRRAVLVGSRAETMAVAHHLRDSPAVGVEVVATYTTDEPPPSHRGSLADVAEQQDGVVRLISESDADVLAVAGGVPSLTLRRLTWALEGTGIEVLVAPAVADVADHRVAFRAAAGMPLLRVEGCGTRRGHRMIKNLVDRVGACGLLGVLAPLMVLAAVAVKLSSSGPVLYRQSRVGQHGRQFEFLKFRTMVRDADDRLAALAGQNASNGLLFKLHDDPRITPVGRFLRRTSIDELPQLWNAVRGDMSLVGPRPLPVYPDAFVGDERRRLRVKPGITGLWQVSGRADLSWEETVRLDLHYVDQWSLGMDLAILIRTPGAVLRGSGAY
jgi:exopolysaccharide biosynthesis polyprenyl glycosylphosphotransferase